MAEDSPDSIQRWTAKRRTALILGILKGETSVAEAARKHGLTVAEVEDWRDRFLLAAENALRARPKDDEALKGEQIQKKIRDLVLDNDILREALKPYPLARGKSDEQDRCCRTPRNGGRFIASGKENSYEDVTPVIRQRILDYCRQSLEGSRYPAQRFYPDLGNLQSCERLCWGSPASLHRVGRKLCDGPY